MKPLHVPGVVVAVLLAGVALNADTLVLRDGRRVQGSLISVRNGVVEFEESRNFQSRRTVRFDLQDVQRIDLDDPQSSSRSGSGYGSGSGSGYGSGSGSGNDNDSGGRPRGLREREVVVSADVPWNDAGVDVRAGQTVYFTATGRVSWAPGHRDGPAGQSNSPRNPNRPIPGRPGAALIGKVGNSDPFLIGDQEGPIRVRESGRLSLGINDDVLTDNSSNFRVTVYY